MNSALIHPIINGGSCWALCTKGQVTGANFAQQVWIPGSRQRPHEVAWGQGSRSFLVHR
jgi:hypothetical protein